MPQPNPLDRPPEDPFAAARRSAGRLDCDFAGEQVPMILRHEDVRAAAKNWTAFSSDAPFRVPIPSEEEVRSMRQLPIETNPPEHSEYREIIEPFFHRPKEPEMIAQVESLVARMVAEALGREQIEVVREFALPLQSRALTYLLNMPESEADTWISWGTHVFRDARPGEKRGAALDSYLRQQFERARQDPGEDFFSALVRAKFRGRELTLDEMMGFANLTFAGGRDTIIHTTSSIFAYFGGHPAALAHLRQDPSRVVHASEEFFRVVTPLTHIGRVCPVDTTVQGKEVKADGRVSLCWASANRDETAFPEPNEVRLDRRPNPHVAFGFGAHNCIGAAHARLLVRSLLKSCADQLDNVRIVSSVEHVEQEAAYSRAVGYESLVVQLEPASK